MHWSCVHLPNLCLMQIISNGIIPKLFGDGRTPSMLTKEGTIKQNGFPIMQLESKKFKSFTSSRMTSTLLAIITIDNKVAFLLTSSSFYLVDLECGLETDFVLVQRDPEAGFIFYYHRTSDEFTPKAPDTSYVCSNFYLHPVSFVVAHAMYVALLREDKKIGPMGPKLAILQKICDPTTFRKNSDRWIDKNALHAMQYLRRDAKNKTFAVARTRSETLVDDTSECAYLVAIKADGSIGLIHESDGTDARFVVGLEC